MHNLRTKLQRFNKCKYTLYYGLLGEYNFEKFILSIDQVQADPFAQPSKMTIKVPFQNTEFDPSLIANPVRLYSFCDAIGRIFAQNVRIMTKDDKGSGNGGFCGIRYGAQKVIEGNSVIIKDDCIELKILIGLPAFGRTIAGNEAQELLLEELPNVIQKTLLEAKQENDYLLKFVQITERQHWLREECRNKNIVTFIANDSVLARASAINDKPMSHQKARAFLSPKELEQTITLQDGFQITGMAIPKGITLIAGGGFHGKSTLLTAISNAIYNHILGDGREYCVTDDSAVFLRAEDGRFIEGIDISPFIHNLPEYKSSTFFQTDNASGSSSQAANLIESLEMGSKLILIDEDISATNFLIRDSRMRNLVPDYKETITPLIAHMNNLKKQGVSLIMVTGALGDFMNIADRVIVADNYDYTDQTQKAKEIMKQNPMEKINAPVFETRNNRVIMGNSVSFVGKKGMALIDGEKGHVKFGRESIDLSAWHHIYDFSQYGTLAAVLAYAKEKEYLNQSPKEVWDRVSKDIEKYGWEIFSRVGFDHLSPRQIDRKSKQSSDKLEKTRAWRYIVKTRPLDWHAALCRLRALQCKEQSTK
ncbi:MAG: ABC-ATPase domain-containing protein [Spirochaetota bacterium]|nr:ABC-ATPase domain-containing protein [Spirochaetota bacterium]